MTMTAIVKPTHGCNLSCEYCYVEEEAEKGKMNSKTLTNLIEQLGESNKGKSVGIIWHGGEPLLMPKEFYEEAAHLQWFVEKENDCRFDNSLQSNGTLFNQEWADFLKERNFSIGFSLDGPEQVNNLTRKRKDGKGAYNEIIRGLDISKENGLGGGFIVVLNKKNISKMDEIYSFLKERNTGAQFNPLINSGKAKDNLSELGITPKEYADAMVSLFDKYFEDTDFKRSIEPLDMFVGNSALNSHSGVCSFGENCQERFLSVGPQGDVYPCGRFDGVREFWMGNLNESQLEDILKGPVRTKLLKRRIENMEECQPCETKHLCNGGCMSNGYMKDGNFMDKDYYCASYKKMYSHIGKKVDAELEKARIDLE